MNQTRDGNGRSDPQGGANPAHLVLKDREVLDDISIAEIQIARGEGVPHDEARRQVLEIIRR